MVKRRFHMNIQIINKEKRKNKEKKIVVIYY